MTRLSLLLLSLLTLQPDYPDGTQVDNKNRYTTSQESQKSVTVRQERASSTVTTTRVAKTGKKVILVFSTT